MGRDRRRTRLVLLAGAALAAAALIVVITLSGALTQLELTTVDVRYPLRAVDRPDGYVVVAIDGKGERCPLSPVPTPRTTRS